MFSRPFCLMVPFWGKRYRDYFVNLCLPSLLAPNNLPILKATDNHRLLVATTAEDWAEINKLPIVQKLKPHITLTLVEINAPQTAAGSANAIMQQNVCWKLLVQKAFEFRGYGSLLSPDCIVADGMIASLRNYAAAGYQLVLSPALRQIEETLLAELRNQGLLSGEALSIPPRKLASLAVRYLHPEVAAFEGANPDWPFIKPHWFWRVPECEGFILRSYFAVPVLMDYSALESHNVDCLDRDIFENVYLASNFSNCERIHVVQDSDDFIIISVTPESVYQRIASISKLRWLSRFDPCFSIRISMRFYAADRIKLETFKHPARWHGKSLNEDWLRAERKNAIMIEKAVGDYFGCPSRITYHLHRLPAELFLLWFEMRPRLSRLFRQVVPRNKHSC